MKAATSAVKRLVRESSDVKAIPKATIEWEHNRFSPFANPDEPVTVTPAQAEDVEWLLIYDINSIAEPNRPRTGIAKARFDHNGKLKAMGRYRDTPQASRFYLHGQDEQYSYFSSTQRTKLAGNGRGGYDFDAPIELTLMYAGSVVSNKVVIGFETSYATPTEYTIEVTTNGTSWTAIANPPSIDVDGRVVMWRAQNGTWTQTPQYYNPTATKQTIRGVRLRVYAMNLPYSHLDVLQIGARLHADVSEYIETYSRDFELADRSFVSPLGGASSNVASLSLSNIDGLFNNDNSASPFFGLIGKKALVALDLSYDASRFAGSTDERIREFTMWVDSWTGGEELTSVLSLKDSSVFLQEMPSPKVFWGLGPEASKTQTPDPPGQMTVGAIIWQIMDLLGMTNYQYTRDDLDLGQLVPYYWPEEGATAWDDISALAQGTQTAVYFDEYDVMQIKTRRALFGERETIDWNLDAIQAGQKLPDIIELSSSDELVTNDVVVTYQPTKFSAHNNGFPKLETVWEPEEDTLTLRSTHLTRDLLQGDTYMWMRYNEASFWPYEGLVNIRGEHIRYKGKEYFVHLPGGVVETRTITSPEEKEKADADSDPNIVWKNSWSGRLTITERGVSGTGAADHRIRPTGYTSKVTSTTNNKFYPLGTNQGMYVFDGTVTLVSPPWLDGSDYLLLQHETTMVSNRTGYGMRLRFPEDQIQGNKWAVGGIYFGGDWADSGYYLEVSPTATVSDVEGRAWRNEISLIVMKGDQPAYRAPAVDADHKGFSAEIGRGQWYDLDVIHTKNNNGSASITAYLNGVFCGRWEIHQSVTATWSHMGIFGMFTRGQSKMEIEYIYGVDLNRQGYEPASPDQTAFLDLQRGGFTSGYIEREWRYGYYSAINYGPGRLGGWRFTANRSIGYYAMDEFGPVIHEMREIEVNFEEGSVPCAHSYLFLSNTSQVACTDYYATPFGAKFTLVNTSRSNAIVKGDDKITYGPDNSINQNIFIYGRVLKQEDDVTITRENKPSIRKNGKVTTEFNNKFIQTDEAANDLADWLVELWGGGVDEVDVKIFGNPFLQIGDLVTINYPIKGMYPATHKYFVVSLTNSFAKGLESDLILRRARI